MALDRIKICGHVFSLLLSSKLVEYAMFDKIFMKYAGDELFNHERIRKGIIARGAFSVLHAQRVNRISICKTFERGWREREMQLNVRLNIS